MWNEWRYGVRLARGGERSRSGLSGLVGFACCCGFAELHALDSLCGPWLLAVRRMSGCGMIVRRGVICYCVLQR